MSSEKQSGLLLIRADASSQMGIGHVMRCLALAQAWQLEGGHAIFLSHCESDALRQRIIASGVEFMPLSQPHPNSQDLETTLEVLQMHPTDPIENSTWLVLDGYHFDPAYQHAIRSAGCHLLVIDDNAHLPAYHADILLNQNLGAEELKYKCDLDTTLLLGSQYALLRQEFLAWRSWQREIPETAHKVLVTMGGGDPYNVTLKVIRALVQMQLDGLDVVVVVGVNNPHYEILQSAISNLQFKIRLECNALNMPELMSWADVAVTAGGSTCWELVFMGVPSLVIGIAENQLGVVNQLEALGVAVNLGWHQQLTSSQIAKPLKYLMMSADMRRKILHLCHAQMDGDGVDRVLLHIHGNGFRLRSVREEDKSLLWEWANTPEVRAASFSTGVISWEQHVKWFASKQNDPNCIFYLAFSDKDVPLGQVRFDIDGLEAAISISLDAKYRGYGYGSQIIALASQKLFQTSHVEFVHAYIKKGNQASASAFLKAKFLEDKLSSVRGQQARHLILSRKRMV